MSYCRYESSSSDWSDGGNEFEPNEDWWTRNRDDLDGFHYQPDLDAPLSSTEEQNIKDIQVN